MLQSLCKLPYLRRELACVRHSSGLSQRTGLLARSGRVPAGVPQPSGTADGVPQYVPVRHAHSVSLSLSLPPPPSSPSVCVCVVVCDRTVTLAFENPGLPCSRLLVRTNRPATPPTAASRAAPGLGAPARLLGLRPATQGRPSVRVGRRCSAGVCVCARAVAPRPLQRATAPRYRSEGCVVLCENDVGLSQDSQFTSQFPSQ